MLVLLTNAIAYILLFFYYWKKDRGWNVFNFLIAFYAIIALLGFVIFSNGIYALVFGNNAKADFSVLPYVLCFISYFIFFYPFRRISNNVSFRIPNIKYLNVILYVWIFIMIAYSIMKYLEASIIMDMGMSEAYELRHMEGEILVDYSDNILFRRLRNIGIILQECTVPFIIIYCIENIRNKRNVIMTLMLVVLSFLPNIFDGISLASRGNLFVVMIKMLFFVIVFKKYFPEKIKRNIIVIVGVSLFSIIYFSAIITNSRLESSKTETPIGSVIRYLGESFPNLSCSFYDKVKYHPMGERLFPEFYGHSNKEKFGSTADFHKYWGFKTGVPVLNFKTLFGDLYIEFGTIGAIIFIICFSFLFKFFMKGRITYYNIGVAYMYFQICAMGFAGVTRLSGLNLISWSLIFVIGYALKLLNKEYKPQAIISEKF